MAQQRCGIAIVNHSSQTLRNVAVVSGDIKKERYRAFASVLAPNGYVAYSVDAKLQDASVVEWTPDGASAKQQFIATQVPWGFDGYAGIEFTDSGIKFKLLCSGELDDFVNAR